MYFVPLVMRVLKNARDSIIMLLLLLGILTQKALPKILCILVWYYFYGRKKSMDGERVRFYVLGHWRLEHHGKWCFSNSRGNAIVWWIVQVSIFDENEVDYMNDADPIFFWWLHTEVFIDTNLKIDIGKLKITKERRAISIFWPMLDDCNWSTFAIYSSLYKMEIGFVLTFLQYITSTKSTHFNVNSRLRNNRPIEPNEFFNILCCFDDWIS